jgi:hypothetical protein
VLPSFVIIGAQKAGSTFFLRWLADHPSVFMPPHEVRFFEDPDFGDGDPGRLAALFTGVRDETALGIKRPGYLARPEVAPRIRQLLPAARLIAVLRDPVERAISAYFHHMRTGFLPIRPVEAGMTELLDRGGSTGHPRAPEVLEFGLYHRHLSRYLELFERQQLMIVLFDDLTADPWRPLQEAYRFIGVDDRYRPRALAHGHPGNPNPGIHSLTRLRLLSLRNPLRYDYDATRSRRSLKRRPGLLVRVAARGVETLDRRLLAPLTGHARPAISPGLRRRLYAFYSEDIDRLEALLGRSLDAWRPPGERGH